MRFARASTMLSPQLQVDPRRASFANQSFVSGPSLLVRALPQGLGSPGEVARNDLRGAETAGLAVSSQTRPERKVGAPVLDRSQDSRKSGRADRCGRRR